MQVQAINLAFTKNAPTTTSSSNISLLYYQYSLYSLLNNHVLLAGLDHSDHFHTKHSLKKAVL